MRARTHFFVNLKYTFIFYIGIIRIYVDIDDAILTVMYFYRE